MAKKSKKKDKKKVSNPKLASYAKRIHELAKGLRKEDGNKKMYKEYVSEASEKLKGEGFFNK